MDTNLIPRWMTPITALGREICTHCEERLEKGELVYRNDNNVVWCRICAEHEEE